MPRRPQTRVRFYKGSWVKGPTGKFVSSMRRARIDGDNHTFWTTLIEEMTFRRKK